jgi:hypothetical protein
VAGACPGAAREAHPELQLGSKRIIISDDFHPSLTKPNVEVFTEKITETWPHAASPPTAPSTRLTRSSRAPDFR